MKRMIRMAFVAIVAALAASPTISAGPKKTIHVEPDNAKIYINGSAVGEGVYTYQFDRGTDFVMVKLEAPGYITESYRLQKDNPNKTILYRLDTDDALAAAMGDGDDEGAELANKWFDVTCRQGVTEEKIWKRLMNIAVTNFDDVEVRDKDAGWIKTGWKTTKFKSGQAVRTRMEVRISFTGEQLTYRVRLESQYKDKNCQGSQCWNKWDKLLKKYAPVISELQTSVGGGE